MRRDGIFSYMPREKSLKIRKEGTSRFPRYYYFRPRGGNVALPPPLSTKWRDDRQVTRRT